MHVIYRRVEKEKFRLIRGAEFTLWRNHANSSEVMSLKGDCSWNDEYSSLRQLKTFSEREDPAFKSQQTSKPGAGPGRGGLLWSYPGSRA